MQKKNTSLFQKVQKVEDEPHFKAKKICRYGPGRKVPIVVDGNDLEVLNGSADDGMVVAQPAGHYIHSSKVRRHDCRTMQTSRLVRNAAFPSRESSCIKMKVFKNTILNFFPKFIYQCFYLSVCQWKIIEKSK